MALNSALLANRSHFDLMVIFNGTISADAADYFKTLPLDSLVSRENVGNEGGAFNEAIHRFPDYPWYLFLHDDHWFWNPDWLQAIRQAQAQNTQASFGNLTQMEFQWCDDCNELVKPWRFRMPPERYSFAMLQGMAGLHPRGAIEKLLEFGGVPFVDYREESNRNLTHFFEMCFSLFLLKQGMQFQMLPGGFEQVLLHAAHILNDDNRDALARLPKAVEEHARKIRTIL